MRVSDRIHVDIHQAYEIADASKLWILSFIISFCFLLNDHVVISLALTKLFHFILPK